MLVGLVARHVPDAGCQRDRYIAWQKALSQLRQDFQEEKRLAVADLRRYLEGIPRDQQSEALCDLIAEHMQLTWAGGRGTRLEEYVDEFGEDDPTFASCAQLPADLVEDELLARYQTPHGDMPPLCEYETRFADRPDVSDILRPRRLANGRYLLLDRIGQGAMGEVWRAFDQRLRRLVAIKRLKSGMAAHMHFLHRFVQQAFIAATLEHPAIASVHEYHDAGDGPPFYTMRLVSGPTLGERIWEYHHGSSGPSTNQQRIIWSQLLHAFAMVCEAVAYAHQHGVLHGDLKPGNVICGQLGQVVVLDWAVSSRFAAGYAPASSAVVESNTTSAAATIQLDDSRPGATVVGTPQYMAPEQANGIIDERSDVFGLGAILYELLAGQSPRAWPGSRPPSDWLDQVRTAAISAPRGGHARSLRALTAVSMKALAHDPAARYPSVAQLCRDIWRYLSGVPVEARRGWFKRKGDVP